MKTIGAFYKKFFSQELSTDLVLFNIATMLGLLGALVVLPVSIMQDRPLLRSLAVLVAIIVDVACIYAANFKKQMRNAGICICFVICILLFPIVFFTSGGINSGIVSWFALGLLFIFLLLDGMDFWFMLLTDLAVILGCFIVAYYHPEYVINYANPQSRYVEVIVSLLITTLAIGLIVRFQLNTYSKMYAEAETNNDELMEKTLQAKKAERQAQSATEAKSNFLANMSHEIRTPINTIMGMDEMILRETSEKKVEEYALDIKSASENLLLLINDILDITKIESGKMAINEGCYQFMDMMRDVINGATIRAKEKDLKLTLDVDSDIPCGLIGDDVRIKQILTNIITNAVKYTHEGGINVTIHCTRNFNKSVNLTFSVKDTGIGIKKEDIGRLFESFERLEIGRNRNIEGAGLGMAITKSLLTMMGSELKVESVYGEGSNFYFTLLQGVDNDEPIGDFNARLEHMNHSYEYTSSFEAPRAHFLVVDDNAMNRKVFVALLKETKVKITEAASGRECLQMIQSQHFDMIFLDHMMPGLDGIETFKAMAGLENNQCLGTPVIALTANAVAGAKERYLTIGFHGFLSKPIVPAQLEKMIRDFLPAELMDSHLKNETDEAREKRVHKVELPEIEGIDWEYALLHFPDTDMVRQTAIDFYETIDYERDAILSLYDAMDTEHPVEDYRIKVHGVKSMANTIGATALGGLAKMCEYAARDGLEDRIKLLTPVLIDEMDTMKSRLSVLAQQEEKPRLEDMDDLYALLEMLKMALLTNDIDQTDNYMKQINSYSYEEELSSKLGELNLMVLNLENEKALALINDLQIQGDL